MNSGLLVSTSDEENGVDRFDAPHHDADVHRVADERRRRRSAAGPRAAARTWRGGAGTRATSSAKPSSGMSEEAQEQERRHADLRRARTLVTTKLTPQTTIGRCRRRGPISASRHEGAESRIDRRHETRNSARRARRGARARRLEDPRAGQRRHRPQGRAAVLGRRARRADAGVHPPRRHRLDRGGRGVLHAQPRHPGAARGARRLPHAPAPADRERRDRRDQRRA